MLFSSHLHCGVQVEDANSNDKATLLGKAHQRKSGKSKPNSRKGSAASHARPEKRRSSGVGSALTQPMDAVLWGTGDTVISTGKNGTLTMERVSAPARHAAPGCTHSSGSEDEDTVAHTIIRCIVPHSRHCAWSVSVCVACQAPMAPLPRPCSTTRSAFLTPILNILFWSWCCSVLCYERCWTGAQSVVG